MILRQSRSLLQRKNVATSNLECLSIRVFPRVLFTLSLECRQVISCQSCKTIMYSPKCTKSNFLLSAPPPFWKEKRLHPCSLELQSAIHLILDNDCHDRRKSSGVAISILAYGHDQQTKLPGVLLALALGASLFFTLIISMFFNESGSLVKGCDDNGLLYFRRQHAFQLKYRNCGFWCILCLPLNFF